MGSIGTETHTELPHFPLPKPPPCRICRSSRTIKLTVHPSNPNGNASRQYYICLQCKSGSKSSSGHYGLNAHEVGWVSWADNRGIHKDNPRCNCGVVSRQDRAGVDSSRPGMGFWTCATGACGYYSEFANGLTLEEAQRREDWPAGLGYEGFWPWLL
ncbi:hypothetical protein H2201_003376 [Coniosporium apollinis]|uniref:GRF-like zinc ribbon domain-containing protein n=1 Tax=Coniosporium apollinis TaxID=61459 RepID=A0ABQ9NYT4_9PEZI|nr:hypothetical protein H2201_003376 [Coniosporium apollinis]